MTFLGATCRAIVVAGAAAALVASSSSHEKPAGGPPAYAGGDSPQPPPAQSMDSARAIGLWKSSFGAVKIENDAAAGPGHLMGVWIYDRSGEQVVGYFAGALDGNLLRFRWNEPGKPTALVGEGYLSFDPQGRSFQGRWWTSSRDRGGEWQGWRQEARGGQTPPPPGSGPAEQAPPPLKNQGQTPEDI